MNTFEGAEEIADISPHAFNGIAMDLTDAITITVASIRTVGVADGGVTENDMIVAVVFGR